MSTYYGKQVRTSTNWNGGVQLNIDFLQGSKEHTLHKSLDYASAKTLYEVLGEALKEGELKLLNMAKAKARQLTSQLHTLKMAGASEKVLQPLQGALDEQLSLLPNREQFVEALREEAASMHKEALESIVDKFAWEWDQQTREAVRQGLEGKPTEADNFLEKLKTM